MIKTNIRDATIDDARYIGHRLRQADLIEIEAYGDNVNPAILTIESFRYSNYVRCATLNDIPVIIYGVGSSENHKEGLIWMLSTDDILKISRRFVLACNQEVKAMHGNYEKLFNFIHKDNVLSKRWLTWMGFELNETVQDNDFQYFSKEITSCVQ